MERFYNGINQASKTLVNASAKDSLLKRFVNKTKEMMETITNNIQNWGDPKVMTIAVASPTKLVFEV